MVHSHLRVVSSQVSNSRQEATCIQIAICRLVAIYDQAHACPLIAQCFLMAAYRLRIRYPLMADYLLIAVC